MDGIQNSSNYRHSKGLEKLEKDLQAQLKETVGFKEKLWFQNLTLNGFEIMIVISSITIPKPLYVGERTKCSPFKIARGIGKMTRISLKVWPWSSS